MDPEGTGHALKQRKTHVFGTRLKALVVLAVAVYERCGIFLRHLSLLPQLAKLVHSELAQAT
jgi:hypothetical protein